MTRRMKIATPHITGPSGLNSPAANDHHQAMPPANARNRTNPIGAHQPMGSKKAI
jgi:hypothetical protein